MDGSSCIDESGAGLILTSPEGTEFTYAIWFHFTASNNEAEYEALIAGLRIVAQIGVHNVHVSVDSKLVANQILGIYVAKEENMVKYLEKAKSPINGFANFSISQVLVEVLKEKFIQEDEVATVVEEEGPTWMTAIMEYLKDGTLPDDRKEASKLRIKARQYELLEGVLYRRSFLSCGLGVLVGPLQADYVIREIHEGSCKYDTHRKVKFLIVAMDYFTKWIEAKAVATITGNQVKKFVWDNIVCRFGLPGEIVSDNVKHPQSNGLVERANQSLGEGIKARLGEGNKNWIEELPHVLWAHRTMIKSSHGDTPFSLTYGTEAVIPAEIGMPTYRTAVALLPLQIIDRRQGKWNRCWSSDVFSSLSAASVCVAASANKIASPLGNNGRRGYRDTVRSGVVSGTNPVGAADYPALLFLFRPAYVSRNSILQRHLFFDGSRIFRIAYLGVYGDL
ncbi:reverse transcriptase domain-containing protein [Tanacetum coccineum]